MGDRLMIVLSKRRVSSKLMSQTVEHGSHPYFQLIPLGFDKDLLSHSGLLAASAGIQQFIIR